MHDRQFCTLGYSWVELFVNSAVLQTLLKLSAQVVHSFSTFNLVNIAQ